MTAKRNSGPFPESFRDAVIQTITAFGNRKELAEAIHVSTPYLCRCANPYDEQEKTISATKIVALCKYTGDHTILEFLANRSGYALLKLPEVQHLDFKEHLGQINHMVQNFSDTLNELSKSVEDGVITKKEAAEIKSVSDKLIRTIIEIEKMMELEAGVVE